MAEADPVPTPGATAETTAEGAQMEALISSLPTRWEIELEFVQSLCNIQYLNYLAQQGHLQDENFIRYLTYLTYWQKPEYLKFLVYPNCLHILTLLQNENFRKEIVNPEFRNTLMNDMVQNWQYNEKDEKEALTVQSVKVESTGGLVESTGLSTKNESLEKVA